MSDLKQDAADIATFFRNQRDARGSKEPVIKPDVLDKADPTEAEKHLQNSAATWYSAQLMSRKTLNESEQKWLASEVSRFLRNPNGGEE